MWFPYMPTTRFGLCRVVCIPLTMITCCFVFFFVFYFLPCPPVEPQPTFFHPSSSMSAFGAPPPPSGPGRAFTAPAPAPAPHCTDSPPSDGLGSHHGSSDQSYPSDRSSSDLGSSGGQSDHSSDRSDSPPDDTKQTRIAKPSRNVDPALITSLSQQLRSQF